MNILYSHVGINGRNGWGRTYYMAKGLSELGHKVVLLTINPHCSFFRVKKIVVNNLTVFVFPDFFPTKFKTSGFAIWSTLFKIIFSAFHKFDVSIADCGHRFTSLPCKVNRMFYKTIYVTEWWDFFGKGGYVEKKSRLFKFLYGRLECYNEIHDKLNADVVIVLSTYMKQRALENGVNKDKVHIIPGGSIIDYIAPFDDNREEKSEDVINIAYIGIDNHELEHILPFLNALKEIKANHKFRLILYGNRISPDIWMKYGLDDLSEHRGYINYDKDVSTLKDVDIFLQLLDNNNVSKAGWPNKLGDYLSFGKPIILSPYGDLVSFVENKEGFFLVDYDKESIKRTLLRIDSLPKEQLEKMGKSNICLAKQISWRNRALELQTVLNNQFNLI